MKDELKNCIRSIDDLRIESPEERRKLKKITSVFPLQITRYYASLIDWGNPADPIRKLVVPSVEEGSNEGLLDTSGEKVSTVLKGVQHKYRQTALVLTTNVCACYCRHCFRRRLMKKPTSSEVLDQLKGALDYIKKHKEIDNVLLSGGDPLMLPTKKIEFLLKNLTKIEHIKTIRFGTRVPAYLPSRITEDKKLLGLISKYSRPGKKIYFVVHFEHPRELTKEAIKCIESLHNADAVLLNQAVLLRGVNDSPETIAELFNKLSSFGICPYYLFQCRPVKNGKHFQIPLEEGWRIFEESKKYMSGLAKRARYVMSHHTGKIEIVGIEKGRIYFKYHQARDPDNIGKFFSVPLKSGACWLDDLL